MLLIHKDFEKHWKNFLWTISSVQSLCRVQLLATPWTIAWTEIYIKCIHTIIYIKRNIVQPLKRKTFWHVLQHGWTLNTLCYVKQACQKRTNTVWFHLLDRPRAVRLMGIESKMVAPRGQGERGMGSHCVMGTEFLFAKTEKFWRWMVVMVAQKCECIWYH